MKYLIGGILCLGTLLSPSANAQRGGAPPGRPPGGAPPGRPPGGLPPRILPPFHPGNHPAAPRAHAFGHGLARGLGYGYGNYVGYGYPGLYWTDYGYPGFVDEFYLRLQDYYRQSEADEDRQEQARMIPPAPPEPPPPLVKPVTQEYSWPPPPPGAPQTFSLAFKDGTVHPAIAVWVQGGVVHYNGEDGSKVRASLDQLDRALTRRLNAEKGLRLVL